MHLPSETPCSCPVAHLGVCCDQTSVGKKVLSALLATLDSLLLWGLTGCHVGLSTPGKRFAA